MLRRHGFGPAQSILTTSRVRHYVPNVDFGKRIRAFGH